MQAISTISGEKIALWQQAQGGFVRYALGVSRRLQSSMMDTLQVECGHSQLRLGFAPYVTLIGERNYRPTELAEHLGITRQACNQAIRQLEAAGFVGHVPDPEDGRAKLLGLSKEGQRLRRDGIRIASRFDQMFAGFTDKQAAISAATALRTIALSLTATSTGNDPGSAAGRAASARDIDGLAGLLPRISEFIIHRLMQLTRGKGHPALKLSFGQVIPLIGPLGGRIQHIAATQDVSKQAISVIAMELEELGYLTREQDTEDARQIILRFTDAGIQLMGDAAGSVIELETEFAALIGRGNMQNLEKTFAAVSTGLGLERGRFSQHEAVDLKLLAKQLRQQLGAHGTQALGQLLIETN
jgi:DNA-binding MarR family transcriptional regulator